MSLKKNFIAGVDEVGKGALFGPVLAGSVVLNELAERELIKAGLKDSKKLTKKKISELSPLIKEISSAWSLGQSSAKEIDSIGIREATEHAMLRSLQRLPIQLKLVLVDGNLPIRCWEGNQKTIINGESHSASIAAASVIAKNARDNLIKRIANQFPEYGLINHVGYGTDFHRQAIKLHGPSKLHRQTFLSKIMV